MYEILINLSIHTASWEIKADTSNANAACFNIQLLFYILILFYIKMNFIIYFANNFLLEFQEIILKDEFVIKQSKMAAENYDFFGKDMGELYHY